MFPERYLPGRLKLLAGYALSFAVSLALANIIYSFVEPPQQKLATLAQGKFVQYDPEIGWSYRPNTSDTYETQHVKFSVSINAQGMRDTPVQPKQGFRIALIGDSVPWGIGVETEQRFPDLLSKALGVEILNFSVIGYSPVQYYLMLDKVLASQPDMVVVVFTLHNDFNVAINRETELYKPYATIDLSDQLSIVGYPIPDYRKFSEFSDISQPSWVTKFALGRLLYFTCKNEIPQVFSLLWGGERHLPPLEGLAKFNGGMIVHQPNHRDVRLVGRLVGMLFERMKDKLDAQHIPLAVMAVDAQPSAQNSWPYFKLLEKQLAPLHIPMATTSGQMKSGKWFFDGDVHHNASGHARIAEIMKPVLVQWIDKAKEMNGAGSENP